VSRTKSALAQISDRVSRSGGTGLGLALCKHFIETGHGGTIGVTSELGAGSEFFFVVSLAASPELTMSPRNMAELVMSPSVQAYIASAGSAVSVAGAAVAASGSAKR
jgi:hypothetical protein